MNVALHVGQFANRAENQRRIQCGHCADICISLEIYVRTISAQHLTKDICLTGEMLCVHSADIVRTYISRNICPHYILLRFSALVETLRKQLEQ